MARSLFILGCSFALGVAAGAGCADDEVDDPDSGSLLSGKADGYSDLAGQWVQYATPMGLRELDLNQDHTYTASYWRQCIVAGCETETGAFKLTKSTSGTTKYIRLTHGDELVARYSYRLTSGQLKLTDSDDNSKVSLQRPACYGVGLAGCSEDPLCEFIPGHPCDPTPNGPACPMNTGPHCEARPCSDLDFSTCSKNPACVQVPGQPCDPIPGGPQCPPDTAPHCAPRW